MSTQKVRLQRKRKYDDEIQTYDRPHSSNAPNGSTLTKVTYSTIPKSSKREPTKSMSPKTKKNKKSKGQLSAVKDQNDSEGLVMNNS